jgi:PEP-CTERM motif
MKTIVIPRFFFLSAVFAAVATASTIPLSSCAFNNSGGTGAAGGFTCNLYPSNPDGSLNDIVTVNYPLGYDPGVDPITPGYLVLVAPGLDPTNTTVMQTQADWLQVIAFVPVSGTPFHSTSIELFTLGCNNPSNPNDTSCFPSYAAVTASSTLHYFDVEPTSTPAYSTPYIYSFPPDGTNLTDHEYNIFFVPEAATTTPEPASLATMGGGALVLALLWRRRTFRKTATL